MDYAVRRTKREDLPKLLEIIHELHKDCLDKFNVFCNDDITRNRMEEMFDTSLVLTVDDEVIGTIAGFITAHIVGNTPVVHEMIWFVTKEHRGHGFMLLKEFENMCREMKIPQLVLTGNGSFKHSQFRDYCFSLGYKRLETHYIRTLED